MLELVLFLQGLGRRKVMGEKRERKTQFVMGRLGFAVLVMREVVEMKSGHLEGVIENQDFAKLSSILIPGPHVIVSCIKSGKKLV